MAEDQNNDEYKFVELDASDNELMGADKLSEGSSEQTTHLGPPKDIKRNAIIAITLVVLLMFVYKMVSHFSSDKKTEGQQSAIPAMNQVPSSSMPVPTVAMTPSVPTPPVVSTATQELTRKVATIELSQQTIQNEVGNVNQQVGVVNDNINNLNNQLVNLQQVINNLSTQLAKQSEEVAVLMKRTEPKKHIKPVVRIVSTPLAYSIQAIIPGRAWLIATNGSTITVREGTKIAGYGAVNLIDAVDGRVVTSSGKVIRFSPEDS